MVYLLLIKYIIIFISLFCVLAKANGDGFAKSLPKLQKFHFNESAKLGAKYFHYKRDRNVKLYCPIIGDPVPNITWQCCNLNGTDQCKKWHIAESTVLELDANDILGYTKCKCTACKDQKCLEDSMEVYGYNVNMPPHEENVILHSGDSTSFECTLDHDHHLPAKILWLKYSTQLDLSDQSNKLNNLLNEIEKNLNLFHNFDMQQFYKKNNFIEIKSEFGYSSSLTLSNVIPDDGGVYTCLIIAPSTVHVMHHFYIEIENTHHIRRKRDVLVLQSSDSLIVYCPILYLDHTKLTWFLNKKKIDCDRGKMTCGDKSLEIIHPNKHDSGIYTCSYCHALFKFVCNDHSFKVNIVNEDFSPIVKFFSSPSNLSYILLGAIAFVLIVIASFELVMLVKKYHAQKLELRRMEAETMVVIPRSVPNIYQKMPKLNKSPVNVNCIAH